MKLKEMLTTEDGMLGGVPLACPGLSSEGLTRSCRLSFCQEVCGPLQDWPENRSVA